MNFILTFDLDSNYPTMIFRNKKTERYAAIKTYLKGLATIKVASTTWILKSSFPTAEKLKDFLYNEGFFRYLSKDNVCIIEINLENSVYKNITD